MDWFCFFYVLPWLGMQDNTIAFATVLMTSFISGGFFLSTCFVQPIVAMMALISEISSGNFNNQKLWDKSKKKMENSKHDIGFIKSFYLI